ncbi:MAG: alpha/beta hydrolase [Pseudorhodoplanes sp.]
MDGDPPGEPQRDSRFASIAANGLTFGYLEAGHGPLVLCLHGFPDGPATFDHLLAHLASEGYHAVAPATRGIAPTSVPADGDYSPLQLGRDALALIDAFGETSAVLIGHDWGAISAYAAANLAPGRIDKIVTISIPHPRAIRPSFRLMTHGWHFAMLPIPFVARWLAGRNDFALLRYFRRLWSPDMRCSTDQMADWLASYRQPGTLTAALGYYRALMRTIAAVRGEAHKALFRRTSVPTLCFAASPGAVFDVATFERAREAFTGSYELVKLPGAGHSPHLEPSRHLLEARIVDFLFTPPLGNEVWDSTWQT